MNGSDLRQKLERLLPTVRKPQQYLGGELNSVVKLPETVSARVALCFPDLYEIGASNTGLGILYHCVNRDPRFGAERAFLPDTDMGLVLEKNNLPLFAVDSFTPLMNFDAVGFTLQYELSYPNIVRMLKLAKIPVLSRNRTDTNPIILMGGPLAGNPMPVSRFADAVVVGDGEEVLLQIMEVLADSGSRQVRLENLAKLAGVYVPSIPPQSFTKARVPVLKKEHYPEKPLVPLMETVHLRSAIEVMRGCTRACRFCAAGYYYRPLRERPASEVVADIRSSLDDGWRDVSLLSLSTADYSGLAPVLEACYEGVKSSASQLALPSTRLDKATAALFSKMDLSRRSGITFAPEAGSERLRRVINKNLLETEILDNVKTALSCGYQVVKLYFMLGLPTETDEDAVAIGTLVRKIGSLFSSFKGRRTLNVSLSPFSPKPGTPFEREALITEEDWHRRVTIVRDALRNSRADFSWGDVTVAALETLFARGDASLAELMVAAEEKGLVLQSWKEHFSKDGWLALLAEKGIDLKQETLALDTTAALPWDLLRSTQERTFFLEERDRAMQEAVTEDCRNGCLKDCGACAGQATTQLQIEKVVPPIPKKVPLRLANAPAIVMLGFYSKEGDARFIPHRDMARLFERAFRVAKMPIRYSQGFSPHADMAFSYPLSLGMSGRSEPLQVLLDDIAPDNGLELINAALPKGLRLHTLERLKAKISMDAKIEKATYRITGLPNIEKRKELLAAFLLKTAYTAEVRSKGGTRTVDARAWTYDAVWEGEALTAVLSQAPSGQLRVSDFLINALGLTEEEVLQTTLCREKMSPLYAD